MRLRDANNNEKLYVGEKQDSDGNVLLEIPRPAQDYEDFIHIDREEAILIIAHLKKVFEID